MGLETNLRKGRATYHKNKFEKSLKYFEKVLSSDLNHFEALCFKGIVLKRLGMEEESSIVLNKAFVEIKDNNLDKWFEFAGDIDWIYKKYDDSLFLYDYAIDNSDKPHLCLYEKGEYLYNLKYYDESLECFNKSLDIKTFDNWSLFFKGKILTKKGLLKEAIEYLDEALDFNPYHFACWYALCDIFKKMNKVNDYERFKKVGEIIFKLHHHENDPVIQKILNEFDDFWKLLSKLMDIIENKKENKLIDESLYLKHKNDILEIVEDVKKIKIRLIEYNLEHDKQYHLENINKLMWKTQSINESIE